MKLAAAIVLAFAVLALAASASVIPSSLTEQKCGNGIREGYELCEPDTAYDLCPSIGKILKIAMACNEKTCNCLPDRTAKNCGNQIREGVEMCDIGKKEAPVDFCPNISMAINIPLRCDNKTCDCMPSGPIIKLSTCEDGKVEGNEDCEADDDCPKGRNCVNCSCVRIEGNFNITPVEHNMTEDEVPVPTIEDMTKNAGKTELAGFVIEDYAGEVIPGALSYFDGENINVYINMNDTEYAASIATTQNVVQEVHPYPLNDTSMEIWITEDALGKIKASDKRTETITAMLGDGTIKYKPTGFFRRIWFWLFKPF